MPSLSRRASVLLMLIGAVLLLMGLSDTYGEYVQALGLQYPGIDKLAHFGLHLALVAALFRIVRRHWPCYGPKPALVIATCVSLAFGLVDEGHQYFVGGRSFDVFDIAANACGTATATIAISFLGRSLPYRVFALAIPFGLFAGVVTYNAVAGG